MQAEPVYFYGPAFERGHNTAHRDDFHMLERDGLTGLNATSIHTAFETPEPNLSCDPGSLSLWFFHWKNFRPSLIAEI